ncbi:hypothetical protein DXG01_015390 [Tephrocybe rancida]|nr:hypothetical protein DXG01_015390 [Tephrocybe rancida]
MRFTFAALALAASTVSASIIARQIPSCANECLFGSGVDLDGCGPTDNICLCKSQKFVSKSTTCIEAACSGADLATALSVSQQICLSVGVTLTNEAPAPTESSASTPAVPSTDGVSSPAPTKASTKATTTAPSTSKTSSASTTGSSSAAPAATTTNAAVANSVNAIAGLAAIGLAALAL